MNEKRIFLIAFFLSGMAALIYEIAWIKPLIVVFNSTSYVLTIITASFMGGLGLGSFFCGKYIQRIKHFALTYSLVEIGIAVFALLFLSFLNILPHVFDILVKTSSSVSYLLIQFSAIFLLLLIPTTLMGATFPLLAQMYVKQSIGEEIGELYASNNAGAIFGVFLSGFFLIPFLGITSAIVIGAILNIAAGFIILWFHDKKKISILAPLLLFFFIFFFAACGSYNVTTLYTKGFCGLMKEDYLGGREILFYEEGFYGPVVVLQEGRYGHIKRLLINGQGSSSLRMGDMRVSTLLGYLPLLINPEAKKSLVVGFGTGATSNILSKHTATTTVEIEPKTAKTAQFFISVNENVLQRPNHNLVYEDARHHLATTEETYDIIVNHPLDPYQSSSSILFTLEFMELVKKRLTNEGLYIQWLPAYALDLDDFSNFYTTLHQVFPYHAVFTHLKNGEMILYTVHAVSTYRELHTIQETGEELIIVASQQPLELSLSSFEQNSQSLTQDDWNYLGLTSLNSSKNIYDLLFLKEGDLPELYRSGDIITDNHPRLEFTAANHFIMPLQEDKKAAAALQKILRKT